MSFGQALVSFVGPRKGKRLGDRYLEFRRLDRSVESFELAHARNRVIGNEFDPPSFRRLGLDPIRVGETSATSQHFNGALKGITARQSEYCIDSVGRELEGGLRNIFMLALDRPVGAHLAHQFHAVQARTGRNHPRPRSLANWMARVPPPPAPP